MDEQSYLSGYTDGEGCFCVTFNKSRRHRFGWDIRPSFSISQNGDRAEVLKLFMKNFQCGTIRPDRSDKTLKYEVRSVAQLAVNVIPRFMQYPLLSSKREDFEMFAQVVQLAEQLNKSGKKKYVRSQIKV